MKRKDESSTRTHFRSSRMFEENSCWYFNTREGEMLGPFKDELEASTKLEVYIRLADTGLLNDADQFTLAPVRNAS
jgi:hypothetical protein